VHVPDGFLDASTSIATGVVAAGAVAVALRGARRELDERTAPMAGLVAAFVFAAQMVNFPVAGGTSGHLLGGALAAVLVGPWTAVLCVSVVLLVQSLLFADGGVTALGTNITLMAVVGVAVGWFAFRAAMMILPRSLASVPPAAAVGAFLSVPFASLVFAGLYLMGGTIEVPTSLLVASMLGWHTLIGIGEALITGLTVASIVATRPDLVRGARPVLGRRELTIRGGTSVAEAPETEAA
jgi:cobalt/nickel transport system permease protein